MTEYANVNRGLAREALTMAEQSLDDGQSDVAVVHVVRAVRLLEQSLGGKITQPTIAQATTRELLEAVRLRCERPTMYSTLVMEKVGRLIDLLPEDNPLNAPDVLA